MSTTSVYATEFETVTDVLYSYTYGTDEIETLTFTSSAINADNLVSLQDINVTGNNDFVMPTVIIGSDGREMVDDYNDTPYTAICYIVTTWPNGGKTVGTGWMFNEYCLMTAAHCVYNSEYGGASVSSKVYPAKNGLNNPYGYAYSTGFTVNSWWTDSEATYYDYAVVRLNSNIGEQCGYFNYACAGGSIGDTITVTGYPGDKYITNNVVDESQIYQWTMSGRLNVVTTRGLSYMIDTYSGQIGSPVYIAGTNIAIGIHTGSNSTIENRGTRISENIYQLMQSY